MFFLQDQCKSQPKKKIKLRTPYSRTRASTHKMALVNPFGAGNIDHYILIVSQLRHTLSFSLWVILKFAITNSTSLEYACGFTKNITLVFACGFQQGVCCSASCMLSVSCCLKALKDTNR